jgi:hypothetical protein
VKTSTNRFGIVILIATVCAFAISSSIKAQEVIVSGAPVSSGTSARLIVNRDANFGLNESVNLLVDGNKVAVLGYNQTYDAPLSAGKHNLSINTDPKVYPAGKAKQLTVTAHPGETYVFTAVWPDSERAELIAN